MSVSFCWGGGGEINSGTKSGGRAGYHWLATMAVCSGGYPTLGTAYCTLPTGGQIARRVEVSKQIQGSNVLSSYPVDPTRATYNAPSMGSTGTCSDVGLGLNVAMCRARPSLVQCMVECRTSMQALLQPRT